MGVSSGSVGGVGQLGPDEDGGRPEPVDGLQERVGRQPGSEDPRVDAALGKAAATAQSGRECISSGAQASSTARQFTGCP